MQLGDLGSTVRFPSKVQGRAPAANTFKYILNPSNMSGDNNFGSFCADQNVVTEANLAFYIFPGGGVQVPPLPMPAGACENIIAH